MFQVSQPYSITEMQFVLKNRIFKLLFSCVEFQMLFNEMKAWRAFCMRLLIEVVIILLSLISRLNLSSKKFEQSRT